MRLPQVTVETSTSATAALEQIQTINYHAIVCDLTMPKMDGLVLLREMRKARPNTPVLFMTGHGDHALASKAVHAGAYDYIHKPIHRDLFVLSITRAIEAFQHRHNLPRSAGASFGALGQARRKPGLLHELTPRQREVLQLIAEGFRPRPWHSAST